MLEPFYEHADAVALQESFSPDDLVQPAAFRPLLDLRKQRGGRFPVVERVKEIEESGAAVPVLVVVPVVEHCDPAHGLTVALRQEEVGIRMLVERIALAVEHEAGVVDERRDPLRRVFVYRPRQGDEAVYVAPR